jgi:hypothetical protein
MGKEEERSYNYLFIDGNILHDKFTISLQQLAVFEDNNKEILNIEFQKL